MYIRIVYTSAMDLVKKSQLISIRLDADVLDWFRRRQEKGYQTFIRKVLRDFVREEERRTARTLGRAQEIFRRYHAKCFWHYDPNMLIDETNLSLVIEGLRKYGGREGYLLADELCR